MKSIKLILICLCTAIAVYGQNQLGQSWILGERGYSVKFDGSTILHDTNYISTNGLNGQYFFHYGNTNVCDLNGNIRYLSEGYSVIHKDGSFMENGDTLEYYDFANATIGATQLTQKSIFLPVENDKIYYVNTNMSDTLFANILDTNSAFYPLGASNMLNYSIIDGQANGGLGKVTQRMVPILQNKLLERIIMNACQHANGKDWWLFKKSGQKQGDSNFYYTFLFRQDTVLNIGLQIIPFPRNILFPSDNNGQMHFNQQGTQIATIVNNGLSELFIADFDRCSGKLSNHKKIIVPPIYVL